MPTSNDLKFNIYQSMQQFVIELAWQALSDPVDPLLADSKTDHKTAKNSQSSFDKAITDIEHVQKKISLAWIVENTKDKEAFKQSASCIQSNKTVLQQQLLDLNELAKLPITSQLDVACFWLTHINESDFSNSLPLLIKSRDLFAKTTLAILPNIFDLKAYGFVHLNAPPLALTALGKQLQAWQFNLYDYKPLPKWLNADYWANPENWNKYRW